MRTSREISSITDNDLDKVTKVIEVEEGITNSPVPKNSPDDEEGNSRRLLRYASRSTSHCKNVIHESFM